MNEKKRIIIGIILVFIIIGGAYLIENITTRQGLGSAKIVKITEKGKAVAYISTDILKQLVKQDADEDDLSLGPSLQLAMHAAGVSEYSKVEVKGEDQSDIILNKKDISDDLIIYLVGNGTMNLCRKENISNFLVKGIKEIIISN
jgi:uncharacterized protein YxeA